MILQHISYDHLEESESGKWVFYLLFTATVGVLLLLNWLGLLTTLWGIDTGILLALVGGYKIFYKAISALFEKRITADIAIVIAIVAALAIGEYFAAAEAVFIMLIGEGLEEFASRRTRSAIGKLIELAPKTARIKIGDGEREVEIDGVELGDTLIVRPGERIPVDGVIAGGSSSINEAPITGESLPVDKGAGDAVFAGSVNAAGALEIKATRVGKDTTLQRIIALVEKAERSKAPAVRVADRYARYFLPLLLVAAAVTFYFTGDWMRTVAVLLVACPCALILATPAAVVAGIGRLARDGVLVKSGASLEAVAAIDSVVFDKTGTITEGRPVIARIASFNGRSENEILQMAAFAEQRSEHAIAQAIVKEARDRGLTPGLPEEFTVDPGLGVEARANGRRIVVGNARLMALRGIEINDAAKAMISWLDLEGRSPVLIAENGAVQGVISVQDKLRDSAPDAIERLRHAGIKRIAMLTGDRESVARAIGARAGLDDIHAELLPQQKVEHIEHLKRGGARVAMVGDGINDAPALATADVGIAMGAAGTDIAIEEADIVLMNDRLERLPLLLDVSRATLNVIKQNIWIFALAINILSIIAAGFGLIGPAAAAATHQVSALLVVLNSLRLLAYGRVKESEWAKRSRTWWAETTHHLEHHKPSIQFSPAFRWVGEHRQVIFKRGVIALPLAYLLSGVTIIGPDESAVARRFGRKVMPPLGPGLHYRWPWPVEEITRIKPNRIQIAELGFRTTAAESAQSQTAEPAAYEWGSQHRSGRYERLPEESLMLTGDENLIEVNAVVQYSIGSPDDYLFATTDPANQVRIAAESALRLLVGGVNLDSILTSGRAEIERRAAALAQGKLDEYRGGVRIVAVQLQDVHPSVEVVDAFRGVAGAFEEKNKLINEAEAYRNEQLELARGQGLARLAEAAGYTTNRANRAEGDAARFNQSVEAFKQSPTVTETRLYLETIEQVLAGRKKLIVDGSKFGRRQMLFVDPQGIPIDPGKTEK